VPELVFPQFLPLIILIGAGFLYEKVGFAWAALFIVCWNLVVFVATLSSLLATGYGHRMSRHTDGAVYRLTLHNLLFRVVDPD
jgi:hypothetical protein